MKRVKLFVSAIILSVAFACNAPETAAEVNESDQTSEQAEEGMNITEDDNTDVQTMEEKYKEADEDVILDSL